MTSASNVMSYQLTTIDSLYKCSFSAMASPCEILFRADSFQSANKFASFAFEETKRIETKFSRYRTDNIIYEINSANGKKIKVDEETARVLDYADQCYQLSNGYFDITSGVLRKCWVFDGTEQTPIPKQVDKLLLLVGWDKVVWNNSYIQLLPGMEIDFGGIVKEYAVDRVAEKSITYDISKIMVNFGGDIRTKNCKPDESPWVIGIENPEKEESPLGTVEMNNGGIATSGDSKRFCFHNGKRLGHILNPKTGWPIKDAPRSITVIASNCTEAGMLATMAMLKGGDAKQFLDLQGVRYNCVTK